MIITDRDFQRILGFIAEETGILLPEANHHLVKRFVSERLSVLKMNLEGYFVYAKGQRDEYDRFLDAITINETYFFREEKQFKVIESMILPQYTTKEQSSLAFWSAACSTGEEAISIAALAEKCWGEISANTYSVFASDLNPYALRILEKGEFKANSFREDGSYFHPLLESFIRKKGRHWIIENALKQKIHAHHINLFRDDLSRLSTHFHLIFLRNVLVYMPFEIRQSILDKIVKKLTDDGYLFLASTETPLMSHPNLKLREHQGVYFFQKKTVQDKKHGLTFDQKLLREISKKQFVKKPVAEASPQKKDKKSSDVEEILRFANQKLNNRLFSVENNINYSVALQFLRIVYFINSNQFSEAGDILERMSSITPPNEISLYFSGYLAMVNREEEQAVRRFRGALSCNESFWLARFYLGTLLQHSSPRQARQEFVGCQQSITSYLRKNSYSYQFLLEGFNAKYFLDMCQKWVKKLAAF